ncbi:alpha/beta fold hydrolase [Streptomyces sp. NPDC021224]|uniref:alpha/beta fold hydrolase n=1 Tax=unclassified Streptomyces TaxID=2593676 RepID=UPI00379140BE
MTSDVSATGTARPDLPDPVELPELPEVPELRGLPEVPGVRHRFVTAGSVRLHVAEAGAGEPVVLLHGFPQHWYGWRRIIPPLAAHHRLLCLDLRGFGWSDAPARGYDTATRVADVLAAMDALGVPRARLIAHEFGAWTGFMACLTAPERFSHFLALNIVHPWPLHRRLLPQAWRYWYTTPLELPLSGRTVLRRLPAFTRYLLRKGLADPAARESAATEEFVRSAAEPDRARAAEAMFRQYAVRDIGRLVRGTYRGLRLTTPTVLLSGDRDFALPPSVQTDPGERADDLRIEIVPDCGHFVHEERPDAVVRAALELFARA